MKATIRALQIIRDDETIHRPTEFARKMWPGSEGWQRVGKIGHGSHRGVGLLLAAGGFLRKLRAQGLIIISLDRDYRSYSRDYYLTSKGREMLEEHEEQSRVEPMREG